MKRTFFAAAAAVVCCAFSVPAPARAESPSLNVVLDVSTAAEPLRCPATFSFLGKLYAGDWATTAERRVDYRFIRSDGATEPMRSATFGPTDDTAPLRDTWTLSSDGYSGWEAVEVFYPRHVVFPSVPFTLTCSGAKSAKLAPTIESLPYRVKTMLPGPNVAALRAKAAPFDNDTSIYQHPGGANIEIGPIFNPPLWAAPADEPKPKCKPKCDDYVSARMDDGRDAYRSRDYAGAAAKYAQALSANPNNALALFNHGLSLAANGQVDRGVAEMERAEAAARSVDPRGAQAMRALIGLL